MESLTSLSTLNSDRGGVVDACHESIYQGEGEGKHKISDFAILP